VIEANAHYDAPARTTFLRIGEHDGKLYLDLCDPAWRAVEIDRDGWRVVDKPPVRFRRAAGMLPLPEPTRGGSIADLRRFLNVGNDDDFVLVIAWVLAAFRPCGPYPVLILTGEQGGAKSTFILILRRLIDPNASPLRSLPREDRDLFIAANNGHVLSFDNVSGLPGWISDTLCRLATGGGFAVRQLYTDQDETLFDAMRPIALNGIEDVVSRPDLADRGLFLTLDAIPEERRRVQLELLAEIEAARPAILGALLDVVAHGLRMLPETRLARLPRLADFALWATACEGAAWPAGTFLAAYEGNRRRAVDEVIDNDPVAAAVRGLMADPSMPPDLVGRTVWTGNAENLLGALKLQAGEAAAKAKTWPESPRALAGRLRRCATFLRSAGIETTFAREGRGRTRTITITGTGTENGWQQPSAPSAPSAGTENQGVTADDSPIPTVRAETLTVRKPSPETPTVRSNPLKNKAADGADGADAKIPGQSGASVDVLSPADRVVL
jgi:hypothetical protein